MDGERFDQWTRAVAASSSRRGLLKGVAGVVAAGLAGLGAGDAGAAHACRFRRRGQRFSLPDGTRCGGCGACQDGVCVPSASHACGPCKECNSRSLRCDALDGTSCGSCGTCRRGRCTPDESSCPACATCHAVRLTAPLFNCRSTCADGARCCPNDTCAPVDGCCPDETRCRDECCDQTETCTADGCCRLSRLCGSQNEHCCPAGTQCINDRECCPEGQVCTDPLTGITDCCAGDEVCCADTYTCKAPDRCCADCNSCQTCENGECLPDPSRELANCGTTGCGLCQDGQCVALGDNNDCTDRPGVCCGGICREIGECCDDTGCPACQRCAALRCLPDPNQQAADCGESGCEVCQDGQCVVLGTNSDCTDRDGVCCDGVCKETCDDPCGPGYQTCELQPPLRPYCCPAGSPCCPGNNQSPDKCQASFGVCCPLGTHQCAHLCCAEDENCFTSTDHTGTDYASCCPQGQSGCAGGCCQVGQNCYPNGPNQPESCREHL